MTIKQKWIMFYTIIRRELLRMLRISSQVFLPPVITTGLYFMIFGSVIGERVGTMQGLPYALFISPGLVMMAVIMNAYGNVSTSLFNVRFQRSIEELLVSPTTNLLLLLGYISGGIIRGLVIALLVFGVSCFFVDFTTINYAATCLVILASSTLFALAGFTNALLARTFDDIMIVPTFILTPLIYLGGVFYTTQILSPLWQNLTHVNPIFYMVNALRHAMLNSQTSFPFALSMALIGVMVLSLFVLNMVLLRRGVGLRE